MNTFIHLGKDMVAATILGTTRNGGLRLEIGGKVCHINKTMLDMAISHPEIELREQKVCMHSGMEMTWLV